MRINQNPAQKLFRFLLGSAKHEDVENIKNYTKQNPSDILSKGGAMSEVVNRCLDSSDNLSFGDAFKDDLP
jgi:hypothetical protein